MRAIVVSDYGGPEKLELKEVPTPKPGPGEMLVKIEASGVNFIDIYHRTGLYKVEPPFIPGMEAAGVVVEPGPGVTEFKPGDRVAYAMHRGSYAEFAVVPSRLLVRIPDQLDSRTAAAVMLQGMTAHYLVNSTYQLKEGDVAVIHAAAGGVGLLLVQMARKKGAIIIATTSTPEKAELVRQMGAQHVVLYEQEDFVAKVKEVTNGQGAHVVYDSVGQATLMRGFDALRPRGMMVSYGQSSGPVGPIDPLILSQKGSLFLTRPSLQHYCLTREELLWRANDVLQAVVTRELQVRIHKTYRLEEAPQAQIDLASRKTTGKLLLIP